ncbi:MAG: C40 family peptidase [Blautia sp.]|nr:C40 family peptidase [Blautia sp.]
MKKKLICTTLALLISAAQVISVSAITEQELAEEIAWTDYQLNAAYDRMNQLAYQKEQLEYEIAGLDQNLVDVMVSIGVLKNDIAAKGEQIQQTQDNLTKAEAAKTKQYEAMKKRIQYLYEKGGDEAWLQMMVGAENLADLLTRAEYTQKMYKQDRDNLDKYVKTINQVQALEEQYCSEKAELEEMHLAMEEQSVILQNQIDEKRAVSANCDEEIAWAQYQATEYANLLTEQTYALEVMQAERIAAEIAAAEAAAAEAAAAENYDSSYDDSYDDGYDNGEPIYAAVTDEDGNQVYDEDGDPMYEQVGTASEDSDAETSSASSSESYSEPEYDEYGNVIDSDNTVSAEDYQSGSSGSGSGSSVVDYATQFVGNPYVWGGTSLTNGADCSGFVQSVYSNFGVSLPRTSYEQQNAGTEVSYSDAQPGDLICYGGHVAIYMGDGKIVHASNSRDGIKISNDATYRTILSVRRLV